MKTLVSGLTLFVSLAATCSTFGQFNIVGYINRTIYPGDNLVANQLNYSSFPSPINNSLNNILKGVEVGATFTKWDASANAFLPQSTYNGFVWSINYSLNLGEGGLVHSATRTTNTFVGEVGPYFNEFGSPRQVGWNPNYADGLHLVSNPIPFNDATFNEVVGRAPRTGEWVKMLNDANQTYTTTTFDGISWDNGAPILTVAQSAWFNLGPVIVPEPSTLALGLTAMAFCFVRRRAR